jgi:threonine dehydratase
VVLLCGGNIDLKLLADLIERQMIIEERYMHIFTAVADKPGGLAGLLEVIAAQKGNILTVNHDRISAETPLGWTGVELLIEVRDKDHSEQVSRSLITSGYPVTQMS